MLSLISGFETNLITDPQGKVQSKGYTFTKGKTRPKSTHNGRAHRHRNINPHKCTCKDTQNPSGSNKRPTWRDIQ